jgi:hypothetical protein
MRFISEVRRSLEEGPWEDFLGQAEQLLQQTGFTSESEYEWTKGDWTVTLGSVNDMPGWNLLRSGRPQTSGKDFNSLQNAIRNL